jgi:hypothetical protein
MTTAVAVVWIVTLAIAYLALPVLANLLLRIVRSARKIMIYARETSWASAAAAENLVALSELERTGKLLERAERAAGEAADQAAQLADLFERRWGARG